MPPLTTENINATFPYYKKKIRCPRNYLLIPGKEPYFMEPIEYMRHVKDADAKIFKLRKCRAKKDKWGNKIIDFRNYYQPEITSAFALENIYDPKHTVCQNCRRCLEGKGDTSYRMIKRLKQ